MIKIDRISKSYGKQLVLDSIDLQFGKGESIALTGPNGSGKTTLIKAILSLVFPDSGDILVNDINIRTNASYRKQIGYMPQISRLPEHMKVGQLFAMIGSMRRDVAADRYDKELYHSFGIEKMKQKALGALSGGMRQKVSAALAFLFDPPILILDEPTAALDPVANEHLRQKITKAKDEGKLILITSHVLNDLEGLINRMIFMMEGKVLFQHSIEDLRMETGEQQLNKMIISKLKHTGHSWES